MKKIITTICLLAALGVTSLYAQSEDPNQRSLRENLPEKSEIIVPDTTCTYTTCDGQQLEMDIYHPAGGSETTYHGMQKPTMLYIFGGGFVTGEKDAILQLRYYKALTELGFNVIAIDYRLGMKELFEHKVKMMEMAKGLPKALQMAVEDLYAVTNHLIANGKALGIDPYNMIISGSSAGAMTVLQADYQLCNRSRFEVNLPEDFRYKGIISFSGGVYSKEGKVDYREGIPSPTLLLHGMDDRIVNYKKIRFCNLGFFGASTLVKRLDKYGCSYNIMRYRDSGHEVAGSFRATLRQQLDFIYENVMDGKHKIIDAELDDPGIDHRFGMKKFKDIKSFEMMSPNTFK